MLERIALILQIALFTCCLFMCVYSMIGLGRLKKMNNEDKNNKCDENYWILFDSKEELINKRANKAWSIVELAEYSNIHPTAITAFEDGVRIPSRPIQRLLYMTFERLDQTIDSYSKLCDNEKIEFNNKFNLVKQSVSIDRES